jgi:hypothetical protein
LPPTGKIFSILKVWSMPGSAFLAGITEHHVVKQEGESAMSNPDWPATASYSELMRVKVACYFPAPTAEAESSKSLADQEQEAKTMTDLVLGETNDGTAVQTSKLKCGVSNES